MALQEEPLLLGVVEGEELLLAGLVVFVGAGDGEEAEATGTMAKCGRKEEATARSLGVGELGATWDLG